MIGLTLKAARVNSKLTQVEAAQRLGISESTLIKYEKGTAFPDVPLIKKIEELYGVSYSDINFLPESTV